MSLQCILSHLRRMESKQNEEVRSWILESIYQVEIVQVADSNENRDT